MKTFNPLEAWAESVKEQMDNATSWDEVQEIYALRDSKMKELIEAYEQDGIIVQDWLDKLIGDEV